MFDNKEKKPAGLHVYISIGLLLINCEAFCGNAAGPRLFGLNIICTQDICLDTLRIPSGFHALPNCFGDSG